MRTDPNELPLTDASEYCVQHAWETAQQSATGAFPHIEAVVGLLRRLRAAQTRLNPQIDFGDDTFYGPPKLVTVDADYNVVHQRPWDHTGYSVEECAETAQSAGGRVLIEQDLYIPAWPDEEEGWVECGFSVEVWPRFRVRW
jgi:hypothetical protein